jgi:hypothetical protein
MEFALEKTFFHPSPEVPHPSFPDHFANHGGPSPDTKFAMSLKKLKLQANIISMEHIPTIKQMGIMNTT